ncbi:MAG: hypothetical protein ACOCVR_03990 [Myxococcota bacterium]
MKDAAAAETDEDLGPLVRSMRFGQYRFIAGIVGICVLLMLLSPLFNRFLEAYEAVVVAPLENGEAVVLTPDGMPRTKRISPSAAQEIEEGTFLRKDHLSWNPYPVDAEELSFDPTASNPQREPRRALPELYVRYMDEWTGTVADVRCVSLPTEGQRPGEQKVEYRMQVELDDGGTRYLMIPEALLPQGIQTLGPRRAEDELERLLLDRRLQKLPRTWEPVPAEPAS